MTRLKEWSSTRRQFLVVVMALCMLVGLFAGIRALAANDQSVTVTYDMNGAQINQNYKEWNEDGWVPAFTKAFSTEAGTYFDLPHSYQVREYYYYPGSEEHFFAGWAYDAAGTKKIKQERITVDHDTTIYARWQPQVVVTFDANGGFFGEGEDAHTQEKVNLYSQNGFDLVVPTDPKQSGKAFVDWYTSPECTEESLVSSVEYYDFTDDITLYAKWTDGYAVTYDFNGGRSNKGRKIEVESYPTNTAIEYPANYDAPSDSRKGIAGWYTDPSFSDDSKFENGTVVNADTTLYAKWVEQYNVTIKGIGFWSSGNNFDYGEVTQNVLPGKEMVFATMGYGSNKNKVLAGFYTSKNGKGDRATTSVNYFDSDPLRYNFTISYTPVADTTLYAYWTDPIIVTFDANGGYFSNWNDETGKNEPYYTFDQNRAPGVKWSTSMGYQIPVRSGYIFRGWSEDRNATKGLGYSEIIVEKTGTVYAVWEKREDQEPASSSTSTKTIKPSSNTQKDNSSSSSSSTKKNDPVILNGIVKGPDGKWAMYKNGKVDTSATGVFKNDYGWWRVEKGYVNFKANGIYQNQYGWWKTTNGKVTFSETGVFKNEYGWWRVEKSKVNFGANGLYSNQYGTWYVKKGKVDFSKNGVVSYNGKAYQIEKGKVVK